MLKGNEAFSRVVIDAQLNDQGWNTQDQHSVRYEYVLPDSSRARELRSFSIMVPSIDRQRAYEQRCRDVYSIQSQQAAATQKAETTFEVLLAKTFNESYRGTNGTE